MFWSICFCLVLHLVWSEVRFQSRLLERRPGEGLRLWLAINVRLGLPERERTGLELRLRLFHRAPLLVTASPFSMTVSPSSSAGHTWNATSGAVNSESKLRRYFLYFFTHFHIWLSLSFLLVHPNNSERDLKKLIMRTYELVYPRCA